MNYNEYAKEIFDCFSKIHKYTAIKAVSSACQGELAVLGYLSDGHDGATAGELTHFFRVGSSRIAAVLNTLEKKGFAIRSPDPSDKRKVRVCLTEKGKNQAEQRRQEMLEHMTEFLAELGTEDTIALLRVMRKMINHFEK